LEFKNLEFKRIIKHKIKRKKKLTWAPDLIFGPPTLPLCAAHAAASALTHPTGGARRPPLWFLRAARAFRCAVVPLVRRSPVDPLAPGLLPRKNSARVFFFTSSETICNNRPASCAERRATSDSPRQAYKRAEPHLLHDHLEAEALAIALLRPRRNRGGHGGGRMVIHRDGPAMASMLRPPCGVCALRRGM
jgi:hypothetical protein